MDDTTTYEYIENNFNVLPKDVLLTLMNYLPPKDLVKLCSTNTRFIARCEEIGAYNRALAQKTPLAKHIYDPKDQLELLDRGMKTLYTVPVDADDGPIGSVRFGFPYLNVSRGKIAFQIKGLPPKRGTKVWIVGYVDLADMTDWNETSIIAYSSKESAIQDMKTFINIYESDPFHYLGADYGPYRLMAMLVLGKIQLDNHEWLGQIDLLPIAVEGMHTFLDDLDKKPFEEVLYDYPIIDDESGIRLFYEVELP